MATAVELNIAELGCPVSGMGQTMVLSLVVDYFRGTAGIYIFPSITVQARCDSNLCAQTPMNEARG